MEQIPDALDAHIRLRESLQDPGIRRIMALPREHRGDPGDPDFLDRCEDSPFVVDQHVVDQPPVISPPVSSCKNHPGVSIIHVLDGKSEQTANPVQTTAFLVVKRRFPGDGVDGETPCAVGEVPRRQVRYRLVGRTNHVP